MSSNQARVAVWARRVFGVRTASNVPERSLVLVEEAIELAQACGVRADSVHRLVDYVFNRPVGEPEQEVAGCMVCLYAVATALGVNVESAFNHELERIQRTDVVARIRKRLPEKREVYDGEER